MTRLDMLKDEDWKGLREIIILAVEDKERKCIIH